MISVDYETCSEADLRKVGAFAYAKHPSTRVLCAHLRQPGWQRSIIQPKWADLRLHISFAYEFLAAWNAEFEYAITKYTLGIDTEPDDWFDTMALAAVNSLPLGLDDCALALGMPHTKDVEGRRLMMKMCKPRDRAKGTWWHEDEPQLLDDLMKYCEQDTLVEQQIREYLTQHSDQTVEQDLWQLNLEMNEKGVRLDTQLVAALKNITDERLTELDKHMHAATKGEVGTARQVARLREYVNRKLSPLPELPDLSKGTIKEVLQHPHFVVPQVQTVLEIRQETGKTSTSKLKAMQTVADPKDHRMRGLIRYCGASRTGRFAGRLVQPQNFPRPVIKDVDGAIEEVLAGGTPQVEGHSDLDIVSSCLRGCLTPAPGRKFYSIDFSQIEARVVAWLAGQQDLIDIFAKGEDVYTYTANKVGSKDRQLGKVLVLACGFGMGVDRFRETAEQYGIKLDQQAATDAVHGWRRSNRKIVQFWYDLERWVGNAVADHNPRCGNLHLELAISPEHVDIILPSGRRLVYWHPKIEDGRLTYMGMNSYTNKWERLDTWGGKLVENVVQAVARDVMVAALLRCQAHDPVFTAHDEIVFESWAWPERQQHEQNHLEVLTGMMVKPPSWAAGLPIAADGYVASRYRKG
jgi:DNA polymerase